MDSSATQAPRRGRLISAAWRSRGLLLFCFMAAALGLVAWRLLPRNPEVIPPGPPQLFVSVSGQLADINYTVSGAGKRHRVTIAFDGPPSTSMSFIANLGSGIARHVSISPRPPRGKFFYPRHGLDGLLHLDRTGNLRVSFTISGSAFGYDSAGVEAAVALPGLVYHGEGQGGPPEFFSSFDLPSAGAYDWSAFPPLDISTGNIRWVELTSTGALAGHAVVGIDHAKQSRDDTDTFISGALIGLAGAALIAGLQEGLHRQHPEDNKHVRGATDTV